MMRLLPESATMGPEVTPSTPTGEFKAVAWECAVAAFGSMPRHPGGSHAGAKGPG